MDRGERGLSGRDWYSYIFFFFYCIMREEEPLQLWNMDFGNAIEFGYLYIDLNLPFRQEDSKFIFLYGLCVKLFMRSGISSCWCPHHTSDQLSKVLEYLKKTLPCLYPSIAHIGCFDYHSPSSQCFLIDIPVGREHQIF